MPDSVNEVTARVCLRLCYLTTHLPLCLFVTCVYIHVLIHTNRLRRSLTRGPEAALLAADASPGSALPRRAELSHEGILRRQESRRKSLPRCAAEGRGRGRGGGERCNWYSCIRRGGGRAAARQRGARSPPREAPDLDIIISSFKRTFPIIFIKIICQNQCIKGEQKRRKAKFSKEEKVTTC